jgi:predicted TIM-barrel fold metal-dependent hydrolase
MSRTDTAESIDALEDLDRVIDTDAHVTESLGDVLPYVEDRYSGVREIIERAEHPLYDVYTINHPTPPSIHSEFGDIYGQDDAPTRRRDAKLGEMAEFGIDRGILDPTLNLALNTVDEPTYATALANAYNSWLLDSFLDDEDRLVGNILVAPQRPDRAAEEIDRLAGEESFVGVQIPSTGLVPPAGHRQYDPIYEAAAEHGLPVAFHGAASATFHNFASMRRWNETYAEDHALVHPFTQMWNLTTMLYRGTFERFPGLDVVFQESGIAWVPYLKWRLDDHYMELSDDLPLLTRLPSEYVDESVYFTTQPLGLTAANPKHLSQAIEMTGPGNVMYASDLPHADFDPPSELFDRIHSEFDPTTVRGMMGETAAGLYGL